MSAAPTPTVHVLTFHYVDAGDDPENVVCADADAVRTYMARRCPEFRQVGDLHWEHADDGGYETCATARPMKVHTA